MKSDEICKNNFYFLISMMNTTLSLPMNFFDYNFGSAILTNNLYQISSSLSLPDFIV
jgi:hypothetical protein